LSPRDKSNANSPKGTEVGTKTNINGESINAIKSPLSTHDNINLFPSNPKKESNHHASLNNISLSTVNNDNYDDSFLTCKSIFSNWNIKKSTLLKFAFDKICFVQDSKNKETHKSFYKIKSNRDLSNNVNNLGKRYSTISSKNMSDITYKTLQNIVLYPFLLGEQQKKDFLLILNIRLIECYVFLNKIDINGFSFDFEKDNIPSSYHNDSFPYINQIISPIEFVKDSQGLHKSRFSIGKEIRRSDLYTINQAMDTELNKKCYVKQSLITNIEIKKQILNNINIIVNIQNNFVLKPQKIIIHEKLLYYIYYINNIQPLANIEVALNKNRPIFRQIIFALILSIYTILPPLSSLPENH